MLRSLTVLLVALLSACAHVDDSAFERGQVWTLADASASDARLVVGRVERRRGQTIAHASVVNLTAPPRAAEALERMHLYFSPHEPQGEAPTKFIVSGMSGDDEEWYADTIELDASPNPQDGAVVIPHIATYESGLRAAVSELVEVDHAPAEFFEDFYDLWQQGEVGWPSLHDRELSRPLLRSIDIAETALASQLGSFLIPVPPATPGLDEAAVQDGAFDEHCRDRATIIINQLGQELGTTLLTRSEIWGLVWRADRGAGRSIDSATDRIMCWIRDGDAESHLAFAWGVSPLSPTDR